MAEHIIEFVARDRTGITAVVTETGVIDADVVIRNIRSGHSGYAVAAAGRRRAQVRSLTVLGSAYLFANWDGSKRNNLHDLAFHAPARPIVVPTTRERLRAALGAVFGRSRSGAGRRLDA